jgi:hypothetical protein
LIQTDAHLTTELSLTHQAASTGAGRKERYMVHLVNFSPVRGVSRSEIASVLEEMLREGMVDERAARAFLESCYRETPARLFGLTKE